MMNRAEFIVSEDKMHLIGDGIVHDRAPEATQDDADYEVDPLKEFRGRLCVCVAITIRH